MLANFSASNFKSIQGLQELNLTKTATSEHEETNSFEIDNGHSKHQLLNSATLYGANASGKSNVLTGLKTMKEIVLQSSKSQLGETLPYDPFRLSKSSRSEETEFEVFFFVDGVKYQYGFTYNETRIGEEWLYAYPKTKAQKWFLRAWDSKNSEYAWEFGRAFTGEKQTWVNSTRENSLFLSTAVQLNSKLLAPVYNWFKRSLRIAGVNGWHSAFSTSQCENHKNKILNFLKEADISIDEILHTKEDFDPSHIPDDMPTELREMLIEKMNGEQVHDVKFLKEDEDGELIDFEVEEESDGTKRLFSFAGPWLEALEDGLILVVDELNTNLHPLLVQYLISFFHSKKTNPNNAQLVFTTHETSTLSQNVFRRDQIWFVEKDIKGRSSLYSLSDFKVKKNRDNLESKYLSGVFGALPMISPKGERYSGE
ncbi:ATP-binding protein [Vibrio chagasii]|nr:ATP-binding protein [Vibrio chagasii]CAH7300902.1 ATP-binding protein [Vibrio chagasii]CAH7441688.1 ATP-binding protein [Vibrio chagasii]